MNATILHEMKAPATEAAPPERPPANKAQVGALCWRTHKRGVQVLLITSRETGRWVIPKGGLVAGLDAAASAKQEAWEEAGVVGHMSGADPLGCFDYDKLNRKRQIAQPCRVAVYPLKVEALEADFPERGERRRKWFGMARAATLVEEPTLRSLLEILAADHAVLTGAPAAP
jgi:8-oxo-dGTP pyrophosphatase MutT (NUDIX family)